MKMTRHIKGACLLFVSVAFLSACLYDNIQFNGMEPSLKPLQKKKYEILGENESLVSNFSFFWVWTVTDDIDYEQAYREMISEKGGDDLINIRTWREKQHWVVGTITIIHIRGTVIRYIDE